VTSGTGRDKDSGKNIQREVGEEARGGFGLWLSMKMEEGVNNWRRKRRGENART